MSSVIPDPSTILIFDSGVGGLSVLSEIKKALPTADYIYLFDNEAFPYGELDHSTLIYRVNQLIQCVLKRHQIDLVVIACNTASTIVLPSLREALSIPIVGVVPAIKPASYISNKAVGLIATPATVTREYTHKLIDSFSKDIPVELLGSTSLVTMAEDKLRGKDLDQEQLQSILMPLRGKIDVAVLGCTHFPLIKREIQQALGDDVCLIDSGKAIANRVMSLLNKKEQDLQEKEAVHYKVYSSAAPKEETALNITFEKLGFQPIEMIQIQDA